MITRDDIIFPELTSAPTTGKIYHGNSDGKLLVNTNPGLFTLVTVVTSNFTIVSVLVNLAPWLA